MATSMFQGFKIKGIDKDRLPPKEERDRQPKADTEPDAFRYPVHVLLEPIRNSDDDPPPNIDSDIRRIWGSFFSKGKESLEREHKAEKKKWSPSISYLRFIRLEYHDGGDCGEIHIANSYLEEVKELIGKSTPDNQLRKLKPLVAWVNQKTLRELE